MRPGRGAQTNPGMRLFGRNLKALSPATSGL